MTAQSGEYHLSPILPSNDFDPIFYAYPDDKGDLVVDWNQAYDPREIDMLAGMRRRKHLAKELAANLANFEVMPFLYTAAEGVDSASLFFGLAAAGMAVQLAVKDSRQLTEQYVLEHLESNWGLEDEAHRRIVIPNRSVQVSDFHSEATQELYELLKAEVADNRGVYQYTRTNYDDPYRKQQGLQLQPDNKAFEVWGWNEETTQKFSDQIIYANALTTYASMREGWEVTGSIERLFVNPAAVVDEILHRPGMSRQFDLLVPYVFAIGETIRQKSEERPIQFFPG